MSLQSGKVSFRQFEIIGIAPKAPAEELLGKLRANAFSPTEFGAPSDHEYGWAGGEHLYDTRFDFEHNVYADCLLFDLRCDTNKVPSPVQRAYTAMEEKALAAGNPSGFISKIQKREAKDSVRAKCEEELRSGKHRKSKLVPVLWDLVKGRVSTPAGGLSLDQLYEIFQRTFGADLSPVNAGRLGMLTCAESRTYEDLRPTRFVDAPGGDNILPEYPWVAKSTEPKNFLGNEFLTWAIYQAQARSGIIKTSIGDATLFFDRQIGVECAYGATGKDAIKGDGPAACPEFREALRIGKVPRKAGLVLDCAGSQFSLVFDPETFAYAAVDLPRMDDAETPRQLTEFRIGMMSELVAAMEAVFTTFMAERVGGWEGTVVKIRKWIERQPAARELVGV